MKLQVLLSTKNKKLFFKSDRKKLLKSLKFFKKNKELLEKLLRKKYNLDFYNNLQIKNNPVLGLFLNIIKRFFAKNIL